MDLHEPDVLEGPPANEVSPVATQMDISEVEVIPDSPMGTCYCHMMVVPDTQPEHEDWDLCHYCQASRARHPVDDVSTDVDHVELGETTMVEPPQSVHDDVVDKTPPRTFRRLRPMGMVDDLFTVGDPGQCAIPNAHDEPEEPDVSQVSWFKGRSAF